ncbi:hypothetical protein IE077_000540 [Cardiosporidium cionae]|uniref:C3H1-type domain-containing protein n=1 Tax=Cardiosporidium cionae TaxID=476202 RepID=A0ABQ7JF39_9APIC|nr:hypothetical protein IE077_000540 [Cardiosporidium cionae]|eukprot:KAF8822588.1 hypothetical protein IE077_000540 [Cardiosporidium cionae]
MVHISAGRDQFFKTKLCPHLSTKTCRKGEDCYFAHSEAELRQIPDLQRTRLCEVFRKKGFCPEGNKCHFAHGEHELRFTANYHKTDLCKYFQIGYCEAGNACRHAHGVEELKPRKFDENEISRLHEDGNVQALVAQRRMKFGNQHTHITGSATPNILRKLAEVKTTTGSLKRSSSAEATGDFSSPREEKATSSVSPQQGSEKCPTSEFTLLAIPEAMHPRNSTSHPSPPHPLGRRKHEWRSSGNPRWTKRSLQPKLPVSFVPSLPVRVDYEPLTSGRPYTAAPQLMVTPTLPRESSYPVMLSQTGSCTHLKPNTLGYGSMLYLPCPDACNVPVIPPSFWVPPYRQPNESINVDTVCCAPSEGEPSLVSSLPPTASVKAMPPEAAGIPPDSFLRDSSEWPQEHPSIPSRGRSAPSQYLSAPPYPAAFLYPTDITGGMYVLPSGVPLYPENVRDCPHTWTPYPTLPMPSAPPGETAFSWCGKKCYAFGSPDAYAFHRPEDGDKMQVTPYPYELPQRRRSHELSLPSVMRHERCNDPQNFPTPAFNRSSSCTYMGASSLNSPVYIPVSYMQPAPYPMEGVPLSTMHPGPPQVSSWPQEMVPLASASPWMYSQPWQSPPDVAHPLPSEGIHFSTRLGPYLGGGDVPHASREGYTWGEEARYPPPVNQSDERQPSLSSPSIGSYLAEKHPNSSPGHTVVARQSSGLESPAADRDATLEFPTATLPLPSGVVYDDEIASGLGDITGVVSLPEEMEYGLLLPPPRGDAVAEVEGEGRIFPVSPDHFPFRKMQQFFCNGASKKHDLSYEEIHSSTMHLEVPFSDGLPLFSLPAPCISDETLRAGKPIIEVSLLHSSEQSMQGETGEQIGEKQLLNANPTESKKIQDKYGSRPEENYAVHLHQQSSSQNNASSFKSSNPTFEEFPFSSTHKTLSSLNQSALPLLNSATLTSFSREYGRDIVSVDSRHFYIFREKDYGKKWMYRFFHALSIIYQDLYPFLALKYRYEGWTIFVNF